MESAVEMFNQHAVRYQEQFMDLALYDESYQRFRERLSSTAARVLDVACGPGNVSRQLLLQNPELDILGIDLAPRMIQLAIAAVPAARFKVHDIRQLLILPERIKPFDGIICAFGLPYLTAAEVTAFVADCTELLTVDGVLYLSFSCLLSSAQDIPLDGLYFHEPSVIIETLKSAGFEEIEKSPVKSPEGARLQTQDWILMARLDTKNERITGESQ